MSGRKAVSNVNGMSRMPMEFKLLPESWAQFLFSFCFNILFDLLLKKFHIRHYLKFAIYVSFWANKKRLLREKMVGKSGPRELVRTSFRAPFYYNDVMGFPAYLYITAIKTSDD